MHYELKPRAIVKNKHHIGFIQSFSRADLGSWYTTKPWASSQTLAAKLGQSCCVPQQQRHLIPPTCKHKLNEVTTDRGAALWKSVKNKSWLGFYLFSNFWVVGTGVGVRANRNHPVSGGQPKYAHSRNPPSTSYCIPTVKR